VFCQSGRNFFSFEKRTRPLAALQVYTALPLHLVGLALSSLHVLVAELLAGQGQLPDVLEPILRNRSGRNLRIKSTLGKYRLLIMTLHRRR
jgi:hypothetical protein